MKASQKNHKHTEINMLAKKKKTNQKCPTFFSQIVFVIYLFDKQMIEVKDRKQTYTVW